MCSGPIEYIGGARAQEEIAALRAAIDGRGVTGFLTAPGPLTLGSFWRNEYYDREEDYLVAVAAALREEFRAITDAGLIVQVDEPDIANAWMLYPEWGVEEYRRYLAAGVDVINHALEGLPEDRVRLHFCWGSGHRPHINDIELRHIVDLVLRINTGCYAIEASNVRHEHEYHVWEDVRLPEGKILMPGVVGHATDLVEHPELIAERLLRYTERLGPESVQAGTDCGIGLRVGHQEVAWAKLAALSEGARLASERLRAK